jgi:hypothetical protein
MRLRVAILAVLAGAALAAPAQACPWPASYPGDDASKEQLGQWMAGGAIAAGLPGELPVMAALVESGMTNLGDPDADSTGFFQIPTRIWNTGKYAGYLEHPELQLQWLIDRALEVRTQRLAGGGPDPVLDENAWGEWIADVERPAEQYRGRYQLRLAQARALIGPSCPAAGGPPPSGGVEAPPAPVAADTLGPVLRVTGARTQRALRRRALLVDARCPAEACVASAIATIAIPGAKRALRLAARERALGAGKPATLRLVLDARVRAAVRRALRARRSLTAKVRVIVTDAAGNQTIAGRSVRLTG